MRVVIADPPAYTPWYDHELAGALGRAGADVELHTSYFRFAELPPARGYRRVERFYPLSSRLFRRSRARLPLKGVEHVAVAASLARIRADVVHVQWAALPQVDVRVPLRSPSVFTAHDLLPRRTAERRQLWKRLLARFDRVVVHTHRGQDALRELGVEPVVIAHPVYPSHGRTRRRRADDPRARGHPSVQGAGGRGRGHDAASRTRACSSPATRRCRSDRSRTPRARSGGSGT